MKNHETKPSEDERQADSGLGKTEHGSAQRPRLVVIIASTRPGRVGLPVGNWFHERATSHGAFEVVLVDLAVVDLPLLDEPKHPRLGEYVHAHTKRWSAMVVGADAFVFVMPEYNHGFNAPLKNAIDYLYREWQLKPVGFVSYGGLAAGTRAVQMLKPVLSALKLVPLPEAVPIPNVKQKLSEEGELRADEAMEKAASRMLDEMQRWAVTLGELRKRRAQAA